MGDVTNPGRIVTLALHANPPALALAPSRGRVNLLAVLLTKQLGAPHDLPAADA